MAALALVSIVAWLAILVVGRAVLHRRAGGGEVLRIQDPRWSAAWWARVLGTAGLALLIGGAVADLLGFPPISLLDQPALRAGGWIVAVLGALLSFRGQAAMGDAWRGDVDPDARNRLVTDGPFRWVRNPILVGTGMTSVGLALLVPNPLAILGAALNIASHEVQVRLVEEPYLRRVHGDAFRSYAQRVGRFVPGLGREPAEPR